MTTKKLALVLGSSKGVGRAIANELRGIGFDAPTLSRNSIDTANPASVAAFVQHYHACDVLVFNTGGPPPKDFFNLSADDLGRYHTQLFQSLVVLLQRIKVRDGGFIFLVSSHLIKDPKPDMILSQAYRTAAWSVLKALTKRFAERKVAVVNLALGPVLTDRLRELNPGEKLQALQKKMPMGEVTMPEEVGTFVRSIIENGTRSVSGQTIVLDAGMSTSLF